MKGFAVIILALCASSCSWLNLVSTAQCQCQDGATAECTTAGKKKETTGR